MNRVIKIPDDPVFIWAVNEVLSALTSADVWRDSNTVTALDAAAAASEMYHRYRTEIPTVIGDIVPGLRETGTSDRLLCDGSMYDRSEYPELWAVLPAQFKSTFLQKIITPDLRNRVIIGPGDAPLFSTGGAKEVTLTTAQMPIHQHGTAPANHQVMLSSTAATAIRVGVVDPGGAYVQPSGGAVSGSAGGGAAHENRPPYMALNWFLVAR